MRKWPSHIAPRIIVVQKRWMSSSRLPRIADVLAKDAQPQQPEHITVNGFVRSVRKQKHIAFAAIGDGSSYDSLQAVMSPIQADKYAIQDAMLHLSCRS